MGIDSKTGEMLWFHEQDNVPLTERKLGNGDTHSNTVWYEDGTIYYIAGDGNCAVKLELSKDGKQIKQIWRNKDIDNYMGGFIKLGNYIYSPRDSKKNLNCIDANNGKIVDSLKCGTGSVIYADNLLYLYSQKGEVCLINPNPKKMELISSFKVTKGAKEHFCHPVIDKGSLYIRHGNALMVYNIKGK
jgi:outer membrane protein assembly factor BamB